MDLYKIRGFPALSGPNSGPAIIYNLSLLIPFKNAFPTSAAHKCREFVVANQNKILIVVKLTTPGYDSSFGPV